jgi:hypothetical protein
MYLISFKICVLIPFEIKQDNGDIYTKVMLQHISNNNNNNIAFCPKQAGVG